MTDHRIPNQFPPSSNAVFERAQSLHKCKMINFNEKMPCKSPKELRKTRHPRVSWIDEHSMLGRFLQMRSMATAAWWLWIYKIPICAMQPRHSMPERGANRKSGFFSQNMFKDKKIGARHTCACDHKYRTWIMANQQNEIWKLRLKPLQ